MAFAFLFPGQGSQYAGMGCDLYDASPEARAVFDLAGCVLGFDLKALCFSGTDDALKQTAVTQPAIFAHSMAAFAMLKTKGIQPDVVAGHSVGELSALVAAGVMSLEDGFRIVRVRGQAMQAAAQNRPGAMAAIIGLSDDVAAQVCDAAQNHGLVAPANFNCPGQVVISGEENAVREAMREAKSRGAKHAVLLPVSGAFHSALMQPAVEALADALKHVIFAPAQIPVVPNVTAQPTRDPDQLKTLLIRQVVSSVRWTESMQHLIANGLAGACEVGPGNVLQGLMRRIDRTVVVHPAGTAEAIQNLNREK